MCSYQPPSWAAVAAPDGYSLEILKEGTIIEKVPLDSKTHYILGRMGGSVDILMEHVSISRHHCCLQFREDGALMALDLGSSQGSFLNKTKLDKAVYQRVNVGDILRFGASTRMYIVNGPAEQMPSEYDSENMKAYRVQLIQHSAKIEAKKQEVAAAGASWGFDEDADNPQSDEEEDSEELPDYVKNDDNYDRKHGKKYSAGLADDTSEVTEKDAAILEKIRTKERKIQNMQEEIRRIYLKESSQPDGLTDGQSAAVGRNDKRILELKESIEDLLNQLKMKSAHREGKTSNGGLDKEKKSALADADEILDTTYQTADISTNWRLKKKMAKQGDGIRDIKSKGKLSGGSGEALTYDDLRQQREEQVEVMNTLTVRVTEMEQIVRSVSDYMKAIATSRGSNAGNHEVEEDAVETFVLEARAKDAASSLRALVIERTSAATKLASIEKLLKIATPALQSLVSKTAKAIDKDEKQTSLPAVIAQVSKAASPAEIESGAGNPTLGDNATAVKIIPKDADKKESKKRARLEEAAQMQSLSSFVKFAEAEKKKAELEAKLKEMQYAREDGSAEALDPASASRGKIVRNANEFTSSPFELGTIDAPGGSSNTNSKSNSTSSAGDTKKVSGPIGPRAGGRSVAEEGSALKKQNTHPSSVSADTLEGGEAVWLPPKNQTGDGKTALNARLGY
jgi:pSer/pThr/pTyr-binding forkhead associated (FHA) protein